MAPAQIMDLAESGMSYSHKKFQGGNARYAHKKFGTRTTPSPTTVAGMYGEAMPQSVQFDGTTICSSNSQENVMVNKSKKSSRGGDIFRPYALGDNTPRKRKHQDVEENDQQNGESEENRHYGKRFAVTSPIPPAVTSPVLPALTTTPPLEPSLPLLPPLMPMFGLQPLQFNAETFALMFRKQHEALCIGETLKRFA
ncbi:uncharacterized protein LOC133333818 [Musca vetustissima]|uniref:uncharacterized protein LOC133331713 n=1 Tax=Musca vetustissima TaxID=27455 RepID=UPI002AB6375C|nr:uncharacterized protein LOC133331713 [Musca vetustissima]XP_061398101.1 uncharacterized protein LOC133333818 [Musca vetustissima]